MIEFTWHNINYDVDDVLKAREISNKLSILVCDIFIILLACDFNNETFDMALNTIFFYVVSIYIADMSIFKKKACKIYCIFIFKLSSIIGKKMFEKLL